MAKLPRLTAQQIIVALERSGFSRVRQSGSHAIYKSAIGKRVTVPIHGSQILHPKILRSILRDADLSLEDLETLG